VGEEVFVMDLERDFLIRWDDLKGDTDTLQRLVKSRNCDHTLK